jgi:hypothetical protein
MGRTIRVEEARNNNANNSGKFQQKSGKGNQG